MQGSHGSGRALGAATLLGGLQVLDQASPALAAAEVKCLRLQARALETPLLGCTPGSVSAADLCIKHTMQFMQWMPCNRCQTVPFPLYSAPSMHAGLGCRLEGQRERLSPLLRPLCRWGLGLAGLVSAARSRAAHVGRRARGLGPGRAEVALNQRHALGVVLPAPACIM